MPSSSTSDDNNLKLTSQHNRNTSEMYYDCLQCTEYCRHNARVHDNENNYDYYYNNTSESSTTYYDDNYYHYDNKNSHKLQQQQQPRFVLTNYPYTYQKSESSYSYYHDDVIYHHQENKNINNNKSKNKNNHNNKSDKSPNTIVHTPPRKRSSLARPVRIYDSSINDTMPTKMTDFSIDERSNAGETAYYTGGLPFDDHSGSESGWPIRFKFEEILELTLSRSRKKKRMKTRKKKKVTLTSKHTHFKDTERLLKVLSINNVDQDCRYSVKRCSIM